MTSVSALNHVHKSGLFGNYENKNEKNLLKVSEIKNLLIVQIVQFKNSTIMFENIDIDSLKLKNCFHKIQQFIYENKILALHDISDGGLISTLCEMSISSGIGFNIELFENSDKQNNIFNYLFNEEIGIVLELDNENIGIIDDLTKLDINCINLGKTTNNKYSKTNIDHFKQC